MAPEKVSFGHGNIRLFVAMDGQTAQAVHTSRRGSQTSFQLQFQPRRELATICGPEEIIGGRGRVWSISNAERDRIRKVGNGYMRLVAYGPGPPEQPSLMDIRGGEA